MFNFLNVYFNVIYEINKTPHIRQKMAEGNSKGFRRFPLFFCSIQVCMFSIVYNLYDEVHIWNTIQVGHNCIWITRTIMHLYLLFHKYYRRIVDSKLCPNPKQLKRETAQCMLYVNSRVSPISIQSVVYILSLVLKWKDINRTCYANR